MKALGASLFATIAFLSLTAQAQMGLANEWGGIDDQYISWCDKNSVTTSDDQGKEKTLADCSASGMTCELEKTMVGGRPAIHALCK